ncbi:unnamed protein product [Prorocentrum cordatum]|uniref:Uncharacterized protein n=1 Tax=Prorocentrum cordatum TaxID=2364126 RepID=A0ABN9XFC3_9DINO|nr:unnamed protein product [Polarella glacialis]
MATDQLGGGAGPEHVPRCWSADAPAPAAEEAEGTAPAGPAALPEAGHLQADAAADDSDAEDEPADAQDGAGAERELGAEEPWASLPPRERELWERVRRRGGSAQEGGRGGGGGRGGEEGRSAQEGGG